MRLKTEVIRRKNEKMRLKNQEDRLTREKMRLGYQGDKTSGTLEAKSLHKRGLILIGL